MYLIWAFDFKATKNTTGEDIQPDLDAYENIMQGVLPIPKPFDCIITPRHTKVPAIIEREFNKAIDTFVKLERDLAPADKEFVARR
ncbi:hypothetical protein V5O48_014105 [Marasmius crinis-equi]|uniref:Uncharacterized protein n=1 Tax=Marasmius crinis-equi TaxID=585013 RepID=A0ABR3EY84_9AGAR